MPQSAALHRTPYQRLLTTGPFHTACSTLGQSTFYALVQSDRVTKVLFPFLLFFSIVLPMSFGPLARLTLACTTLFSSFVAAQLPVPRLSGPITASARVRLVGSAPHFALAQNDRGALADNYALNGVTLVLKPSEAQQADLQQLSAAQLDPASPQFHQWLTPDQFSSRFGLSAEDLDKIATWLASNGLLVQGHPRSGDRLTFSGTSRQISTAFATSIHRFHTPDGDLFAPASDLLLPSELAPLVTAVLHLSEERPRPALSVQHPYPQYTTASQQKNFLDPLDLATQYDVTPLYSAGTRGSGQGIAVVGQSYTTGQGLTSLAAGLNLSNSPSLSMVSVPNSGTDAALFGDETEADIDLGYSGVTAPAANIFYVYVGNNTNYNVFDAVSYAVSTDIAPIISISYGACELAFSASQAASLSQLTQQANIQGQTIIAAAGDQGSDGCFYDGNLAASQRNLPATIFPAALAQVTAVGGLQLAPLTFTPGNTQYFTAASGTDIISSLKGYTPEVVWNEDAAQHGRLAGGGGQSTLIPRPAWQSLRLQPGFRLLHRRHKRLCRQPDQQLLRPKPRRLRESLPQHRWRNQLLRSRLCRHARPPQSGNKHPGAGQHQPHPVCFGLEPVDLQHRLP